VYDDSPVLVEYTILPYVETLDDVIRALHDWGKEHRKKIFKNDMIERFPLHLNYFRNYRCCYMFQNLNYIAFKRIFECNTF